MKSVTKMALGGVMFAAVAVATAYPAKAAVMGATVTNITASWLNPDPSSVYLDNEGRTVSARWGVPATWWGGRSGYDFRAKTTPSDVEAGESFKIGSFKHLNYPIYGTALSSISLSVTFEGLIKGSDTPFQVTSLFDFEHTETPNVWGRCPTGSRSTCDDIVTATLNEGASQSVVVDGMKYLFTIAGFQVNGEQFENWLTKEKRSNKAHLVASLEVHPVPLPAAAWFLLTALGGLFGMRWLKRSPA